MIFAGAVIYVQAAIWTDEPPKVYPARADYRKAKYEEALRNLDPNNPSYKTIEKELTKVNRYVLNKRFDVNKDGIVDQNDLAGFEKAMGSDGRGLAAQGPLAYIDVNDSNYVWVKPVYGDKK
jgi:hypothetical protein